MMELERLTARAQRLETRVNHLEYMVIALTYELGAVRAALVGDSLALTRHQGALEFLEMVVGVSDELIQADEELTRKARELLGE